MLFFIGGKCLLFENVLEVLDLKVDCVGWEGKGVGWFWDIYVLYFVCLLVFYFKTLWAAQNMKVIFSLNINKTLLDLIKKTS